MRPKFPALEGRTMPLPHGRSSYYVPAEALARWNPALAVRAENAADEATISIFDVIGFEEYGGVGPKRIAGILRAIGPGKRVAVYINSPGGDIFAGLAIYNLLRDYDGQITVRVIGLAASAASIIAMAGEKIEVARAGFLMIHNCWVLAIGNRNELRAVADWLEPFDDAGADIYAARSGKEKKAIAKLMDKETWFSGSQAIEQGFADDYLPADQIEEKDDEQAAARRSVVAQIQRAGEQRGLRAEQPQKASALVLVETRTFALSSIRAEKRDEGIRVTGHAAVFDQLSEDLGGFREKIKRGAFAKAIKTDDVRALFNHDENHVLGRNKAGTLVLEEGDVGLKAVIDLPDTQVARDLAVLLERGDVNQMSFAFQVAKEGQEWRKSGDAWERTITEVSRLWDVSVVTFAAYPATDAALRALDVLKAAVNEDPQEQRQAEELAERRKAQLDRLAAIDL